MPELKVSKIKNGTVIDHIPPGNGRKILNLLEFEEDFDKTLSLIMNVGSSKRKKKDIIKIEDKELNPWEIETVSVFAPDATLNIIKDFDVEEKRKLKLPEKIESVLRCPNPECITNAGEPVETCFVLRNKNPIKFECTYCESKFVRSDFDLEEF